MHVIKGMFDTPSQHAVSPPAIHHMNHNQPRRGSEDGKLHLDAGRVPGFEECRRSCRLHVAPPLKPLKTAAQGQLLVHSKAERHGKLSRDGETDLPFKADSAGALRSTGRRFVESERNLARSVANYRAPLEALVERAEAA